MSRGKFLRRLAGEILGEDIARRLWGRLEVVGDIAIIRKPPDIDIEVLRPLGEAILERLPYVKSVWVAVTPISGTYRVRDYVHIAGEPRSTTIYKEHGCLFKVDIRRVYISPALNYEHIRIAKLVRNGEFIINMFAGAGLFSIIIAKYARPRKVISIDINPYAYGLMVDNVRLNKVEGIVEPVLGDASEVVVNYEGMADRILMPLPELAFKYYPKALIALRDQGYIHVYEFVSTEKKRDALTIATRRYEELSSSLNARCKAEFTRVVRSVGPRYYQVVLDMFCIKK